MMIDFGKPVQTRDGRKVRILCTDAKGDYPIVALIPCIDEVWDENALSFTKAGKLNKRTESNVDLINVPEEHTVWLNVYGHGNMAISYVVCLDRDDADGCSEACSNRRIACIPVTYTEGEGLNDDNT